MFVIEGLYQKIWFISIANDQMTALYHLIYSLNVNVQSNRLNNLRALVGRFATQQDFADSAGVSVQYLSHLLHGRRNIGEKTARKIERALRLESGFLDRSSGDDLLGVAAPGLSYRAEKVGKMFDLLSPERQDAIWEIVNALAQQGIEDADSG